MISIVVASDGDTTLQCHRLAALIRDGRAVTESARLRVNVAPTGAVVVHWKDAQDFSCLPAGDGEVRLYLD